MGAKGLRGQFASDIVAKFPSHYILKLCDRKKPWGSCPLRHPPPQKKNKFTEKRIKSINKLKVYIILSSCSDKTINNRIIKKLGYVYFYEAH
jgi:hypothetical protein